LSTDTSVELKKDAAFAMIVALQDGPTIQNMTVKSVSILVSGVISPKPTVVMVVIVQ
jgi:hypothetical protein